MSRAAAVYRRISQPGDKLMLLLIAGSGILTQFLTLVSGVIAARMLGVEGRGQVVLVAVLAQMASQLTLGGSLPNAITKELAGHGLRARDGLHGMVGRWLVWGLLGGLGAAAYFLATEGRGLSPTAWALAVGTALMAMLAMTSRILIGSMLGESANPITIAMTGVLPQFVAVVVLGTALALGIAWNPVEIVVVMLLCQALVLATRIRSLAPPTGAPENRLDRRELARLARQTHIGSIGPLDGLALDRVLVGSIIGSVALGLYSAAVALGSLATILGATVAMVALPRIAAAQRLPAEQERALVRRWIVMSAAVLIPTIAIFELATPFVLPLLFGDEFRDAIPCGYWYVAAAGFLAFRRILIATLQGRGRGSAASWIEIALTPFVLVAVWVASLSDDVEVIGMGMLAVGLSSCLILGAAVARLSPAPFSEREPLGDPEARGAAEADAAPEPA